MATPTVTKLKEMLDSLSERVEALENRMKTSEEQSKENTAILKQVNITVQAYERTINSVVRFLRWGGGLAVTAVVGQAVVSIFHLFGH